MRDRWLGELPTTLAIPIGDYLQEDDAFKAIHRLCDAAEFVTRFLCILALSDVYRQLGDFPDNLKEQLVSTLPMPSFGSWVRLTDVALRVLADKGQTCFIKELVAYWETVWQPLMGDNAGDDRRQIVSLRNNVAHAGRLTDEAASKLLDYHKARFEVAIEGLLFLAKYPLIATHQGIERPLLLRGLPKPSDWSSPELDQQMAEALADRIETGQVYLLSDNDVLNLFPLQLYDTVLSWHDEDQSFRQIDRPSSLLYLRRQAKMLEYTALGPNSHFSQRGRETLEAFISIFKLEEWQRRQQSRHGFNLDMQRGGYDFRDLLEQHFPKPGQLFGREQHRNEVREWVEQRKHKGGILWISGKPGVGKSALMATLFWMLPKKEFCVVPYFFRNGDARCQPDGFYQAATVRLIETFSLRGELDPELSPQERFNQLLKQLRKQRRRPEVEPVVFILDGLEEVADQYPDFVNLPLTHQQASIIWICAGRSVSSTLDLAIAPGVEHLWTDGELPSLADQDIRAMVEWECGVLRYKLYERDKIEDDDYSNRFVDELARRSAGLPLYVKLVVEDLRRERLTFDDEDRLPESLQAYFEQLLQRLGIGDIPQMLTDVLALLVWAAEPLPQDTIAEILAPLYEYTDDWREALDKALQYGLSMMRQSRTPEGDWGWMLFHESLRQHLRESPAINTARIRSEKLLLDWCSQWKKQYVPYAMRHYIYHLSERGDLARIHTLMANKEWTLNQELFDLSLATYLKGIKSAINASKKNETDSTRYLPAWTFLYAIINDRSEALVDSVTEPLIALGDTEVVLKFINMINDPAERAVKCAELAVQLNLSDFEDEAFKLALVGIDAAKLVEDRLIRASVRVKLVASLANLRHFTTAEQIVKEAFHDDSEKTANELRGWISDLHYWDNAELLEQAEWGAGQIWSEDTFVAFTDLIDLGPWVALSVDSNRLKQEIDTQEIDLIDLSVVIQGLATAGDSKIIDKLLPRFERAGWLNISETVSFICSALASTGRLKKAIAIAEEITAEPDFYAEALVQIAVSAAKESEEDLAKTLLLKILDIPDIGEQAFLYALLDEIAYASALVGEGNIIEKAYRRYDRELLFEPEDLDSGAGKFVEVSLEHGFFQQAVTFSNSIADGQYKLELQLKIIRQLTKAGLYEDAFKVAEQLGPIGIETLSIALARLGEPEQAAALIEQDIIFREEWLRSMAFGFAKKGLSGESRSFLSQIVNEFGQDEDIEEAIWTFALMLIEAARQSDKLDQVQELRQLAIENFDLEQNNEELFIISEIDEDTEKMLSLAYQLDQNLYVADKPLSGVEKLELESKKLSYAKMLNGLIKLGLGKSPGSALAHAGLGSFVYVRHNIATIILENMFDISHGFLGED